MRDKCGLNGVGPRAGSQRSTEDVISLVPDCFGKHLVNSTKAT